MFLDRLLEKNLLPDWLIRIGIRNLLAQKLKQEARGGVEAGQKRFADFVNELKASPIALKTKDANRQHYEVPSEFFKIVLGKRLKYSATYLPTEATTLDQSEEVMLALTAERARIQNGQSILELGCGWGSFSLYLAQKFPKSRITGVSNSRSQKEFIDSEARARGLTNVTIITADMNDFDTQEGFDRIVSVEMFEHMRNYEKLLAKVASWMNPGGFLFIHIFSHTKFAYPYVEENDSDWIARHFFSGGIMPSDNLLLYFQKDVRIADHWRVGGRHYQKTCEAWLQKMDSNRPAILKIFEKIYGNDQIMKFWAYWRIFFMSCAELFGYAQGNEWIVSHYLFEKQG